MKMELDQFWCMADQLSPMHIGIDSLGQVLSSGKTLKKMMSDTDFETSTFFDVFKVLRPRGLKTVEDLMKVEGVKLHIQMRGGAQTRMKAVLAKLPNNYGAFLHLSFGISVIEAVRDYKLTAADFAVTDQTIEMLYLVEAKSAAMNASRQLNSRLQGAKIAAEEQAFTDTLTGLKNRRAMDHVLDRLISTGKEFSLMHLDLDLFKQVNDTLGHAAGDTVLQRVAAIMVENVREGDTVARIGGDEFVFIFNGMLERQRIKVLAERLIRQIEDPIQFGKETCKISASAGTTMSTSMIQPSAAVLLQQADYALYAAKGRGRAQHVFFGPDIEAELAVPSVKVSAGKKPKTA